MPADVLRGRGPGRLRRLAMRLGVIGQLLATLTRSGRYWLLPMVIVFVLTGALLGVVSALEYVAPFVYTMF